MISKKADISISASKLIDLFYIAIIIILLLGVTMKIRDTRIHDLRVSVRDAALTHDTILAAPGKVNYQLIFKQDIKVDLKDNCIMQSSINGSYTPERYNCAFSSEKLVVSTEGNKMRFTNGI